jgi:subfamily B ATP-binding cassette protein HlyB/CyaB
MDTGLNSLVAIARFHQLPAEPEQLAHEYGQPGEVFADTEILRAVKALTLKAKQLKPSLSALKSAMLPAIAKARDGSYLILARIAEGKDNESGIANILVHDLRDHAPKTLSEAE